MAELPHEEPGEQQERQVPQGPQSRVIQDIVVPQEGQPPQGDFGKLEVIFSLLFIYVLHYRFLLFPLTLLALDVL